VAHRTTFDALESIETLLDLVGLIPGAEFADAANVVVNVAQGDTTGALLSAAAMVPLGGQLATAAKIERHHSLMKYLGGAERQLLVPLAADLHRLYHSGLDKITPRQWGAAYYSAMDPVNRADPWRRVAEYTQAFDDVHGTEIYNAMRRNGFKIP
jgi:hypothetical protein